MADEAGRIEAVNDAIRLARELSAAIAKAEDDLGAAVSVEIETVQLHDKQLKQVMIYPMKW